MPEPATITIPFALGQPCWQATYCHTETWVTCPECVGTKVLTVTMGNGQTYEMGCAACTDGFESPRGVVRHIENIWRPQRYTPQRVTRIDGEVVEYTNAAPGATCYGIVYSDRLYHTEAEAQVRCDAENIREKEEEERRALANLMSKRRDLAWSVHYWTTQAIKLRRDLERAEARVRECKERKRPHV